MDLALLAASTLFRGLTPEEIETVLPCLRTKEKTFEKGTLIYAAGDCVSELGVVLSGSVSIESDDLWGNRTILDCVEPGRVFAETYACVPGEPLMVNAAAREKTSVLFLDAAHILKTCTSACEHHQKIIRNLLMISAQKNLNLSRRSLHTAPKSIRGRVLSYLSYQARRQGKAGFDIPFNRQQLADYLNVDRSALSAELGKMQKEGLIKVKKNHFVISDEG